MRWLALLCAVLAAGCGRLVDDALWFEDVTIESPADGAILLGRGVIPVEVSVECDDVQIIAVDFEDWSAGWWTPGSEQAPGCSGRPHTYCVPTEITPALGLGRFWPAQLRATLSCAHRPGDFPSAAQSVYVAPFDALAWVPATARSLFGAPGGGVIAVSAGGVHRVGSGGEIAGLANRSSAARAFTVGGDVYYYAPCEQIACDAAAPDLFRIDAATLAPVGASTRLGCTPIAIVGLDDQRVIALGDCAAPRVRWTAADLSPQAEDAVDVRLTDRAARRGDEVVVLAWRDDELVIVAAGTAPPLAVRPTGVHGQLAALSDDGARAAVIDPAGRLVHIATATGAVVAWTAFASRDAVAIAYAPGTHHVIAAFTDAWWLVADDASPATARRVDALRDDDGTPLTVRAAAALDSRRTLVIADPPESTPPRRLVYVTDGTTTALHVWVGADWQLTAPPVLRADGTLYLAFDTLRGPVVVWHRIAAP